MIPLLRLVCTQRSNLMARAQSFLVLLVLEYRFPGVGVNCSVIQGPLLVMDFEGAFCTE